MIDTKNNTTFCRYIFLKLDFNQPNEAPKPINNKKGIKKIEINLLKKGGPTEILVSFITSKKIG